MPEEKHSPQPQIDQAEWDRVREGVPREMQAARLIVSREIGGIPHVPYLRGDSDHAPVVKAVAGFAAKCYTLFDEIANVPADMPTREEWDRIIDANAEMAAAMEHFNL